MADPNSSAALPAVPEPEIPIPLVFRRLGPRQIVGLRQEWIAAEVPGVGDVRLMSSAGLGGGWVSMEFMVDGKLEMWVGSITDVFRAFVATRFPEGGS